ncbi:MAG: hypothetical protein ACLVEV_09480 [Lachnospiraceae bacterium]
MAVSTKRITDLPEKTEVTDEDLIAVGNAGTASLRKTKWSAFWNKILSKIRSDVIVNNKTTTAPGYALDARVGKDIQEQVNDLNTKSQIYDLTGWTHIPAGNYNAGEQRFVKQGVVFRDLIFVLQDGDAFEYVEICSPFGHLPDSYFKFQTTKGAASIFVAASIGTIDLRFMPMDVRQVFYRI